MRITKVILCAVFLCLSFVHHNAQKTVAAKSQSVAIRAKVDRRIELTSIIARLAGYNEYIRNDFKSYTAEIDEYFGKHKNHPAVEFARKVRETNSVSYDAVPSLAVHLNQNLTPKFAFSDKAPDERWGRQNAEEFAKLLQQFCRDADCESFFSSHAAMYRTAEERMQAVISQVDFAWYKKNSTAKCRKALSIFTSGC